MAYFKAVLSIAELAGRVAETRFHSRATRTIHEQSHHFGYQQLNLSPTCSFTIDTRCMFHTV